MTKQTQIEALRELLATLEAEQEESTPEPKIDWSKMIGRVVEVRDYDRQEWNCGVFEKFYPESPFPFCTNEDVYKQCRLYQGPTRPNWIEWDGGECPVDEDSQVLVMLRGGHISAHNARLFVWHHSKNQSDIIRYTVIEP